jgi:hypothetical protein
MDTTRDACMVLHLSSAIQEGEENIWKGRKETRSGRRPCVCTA